MEVKRVRVSVACDACKKRRGKCAGTSPCDYCQDHNVVCSFSTKSKKRGPASKHPKLSSSSSPSSSSSSSSSSPASVSPSIVASVSSSPSSPSSVSSGPSPAQSPSSPSSRASPTVNAPSRYTDPQYIEESVVQIAFMPQVNLHNVMAPSSLQHHLLRFSILSHVARTIGDIERSKEFFGTARQISGQIYDCISPSSSSSSPSYSPFSPSHVRPHSPSSLPLSHSHSHTPAVDNSAAVAFGLMAQHCMMERDPRAIHFAHLARSHSRELGNKDWKAGVMGGMTYVATVTMDDSLTTSQKHDLLLSYISTIKKSDHSSNLATYLIGAGTLVQVIDPLKARREGLLSAIHDISYSREIHDKLVQDIERAELLLNTSMHISTLSHKLGLLVLMKMYRTLVDLWSGNYSHACTSAREMLDVAQRSDIADLMRNNTVVASLIPNLATFGTLQGVMTEVLKYFRPSLDDSSSLFIHPNISSLLGGPSLSPRHSPFYDSESSNSGNSTPSNETSLSHPSPPLSDGSINNSSSSSLSGQTPSAAAPASSSSPTSSSLSCSPHAPPLSCSPHAPALLLSLASSSPSSSSSSSSSSASSASSSSSSPSPSTSSPSNIHLPSLTPLKQIVNYGLNNYSSVNLTPLSLPPTLSYPRGLPSLHPLPRASSSTYVSPHMCNYMQDMPPLRDFYGVM